MRAPRLSLTGWRSSFLSLRDDDRNGCTAPRSRTRAPFFHPTFYLSATFSLTLVLNNSFPVAAEFYCLYSAD